MKKALSVLLCLCLVLSAFTALPFTASAATLDEATKSVGVNSGTTGDCTWTLDNEVLTISGNGAMENYNTKQVNVSGSYYYKTTAPWGYSMTSVIIENGVTNIGKCAFCGCSKLTSVTIHDSVTSIGDESFYGCTELTNVTIPENVTSIGGSAFSGCIGLTSITIPDSVTSIGGSAFYNTAWYNNQPDGLVYVGKFAYKYKGTMPSNTSIVIRDGTKEISGSAFYECTGLTSVTIPDSVTNIGRRAFAGCKELIGINIPDSVKDIGFAAFYSCVGLEYVGIGNGVINIGEKAFMACKSLKNITIPNSVKSISYDAFSACSSLSVITVADSVTDIYDGAFDGTAWFNNQPDGLVYAGRVAYKYKGIMPNNTSITLTAGTKGIANLAFVNCAGLNSITIPYSVTKINLRAFAGCTGLSKVTIPDSVVSIGIGAFSGCTGLTSVTIGDGVTSIGDSAFYDCTGLTSVTIGDGVTSIGDSAFYGCSNLFSIIIPEIVAKIGKKSFGYQYNSEENSVERIPRFTIFGKSGSAAETYAKDNGFTFINLELDDTVIPVVSLSSTNNVASSQTVTIGLSDNVGIKGYYWGTSSIYSNNSYTATSSTSITKTINSLGTYYVTAVDTSGNISDNKSITFYKTTLKANGGSVSPTSVLTKSGNSFTFPTPTRNKYIYVGWSTSSSATSGVKTLSPTSSSTYYAVWKTNSSFVWGQDNWNFLNSAPTYFPSSTYRKQINNTYLNKLKSNLSNSEYQAVFEGTWYSGAWLDDWWGGSCYGMSSLTLLSKIGMLSYSSYQSGATKLYDLGYPKNNSNLLSLITYYQMLQVKDVIQQQYRTVPNKTNLENITNLINLLDKNPTVLVGFKKTGWGGHAILATGYEYGSWTFNGVSYQGCIKICDPNASTSYNTRYNIYFNTKSYNWTIPAYSNMTSTAGAKFNYIGATVNEINKGGYLSGTSGNKVDDFVARIDAIAISDNRSVSKVEDTNGVYINQSSQPNEIVEDYSFILGNESEGTIGYNLYDANSSYKISQSNAEKLQLYMDYENCSLTGGSAAGESVIFDKSGYVEVNGESAMYNMSMTYDETYPTDWFAIQVQGYNANSASLRMVNDGYVLTADNLENVSLRANNRETYAKVAFSTEYNSVFIYEVDENTIGIRVDTDGNGTYETELPTNTFQFGDTNLDGAISISDVTAIQRHLADLSSFSDEQLTVADTNGDGKVDINDATHLQMYLAEFDVVLGKRKSK